MEQDQEPKFDTALKVNQTWAAFAQDKSYLGFLLNMKAVFNLTFKQKYILNLNPNTLRNIPTQHNQYISIVILSLKQHYFILHLCFKVLAIKKISFRLGVHSAHKNTGNIGHYFSNSSRSDLRKPGAMHQIDCSVFLLNLFHWERARIICLGRVEPFKSMW